MRCDRRKLIKGARLHQTLVVRVHRLRRWNLLGSLLLLRFCVAVIASFVIRLFWSWKRTKKPRDQPANA